MLGWRKCDEIRDVLKKVELQNSQVSLSGQWTAERIQIITIGYFVRKMSTGPTFYCQEYKKMDFRFINATICAFLTGLGILGNTSVFVIYVCNFGGVNRSKSIQLILIHLVFTNFLMLVSKGIPKTIAAFGVRNFLDDIGCKTVVYLERVARGLSICTSSLLTVVQAVTISPRHTGWRRLKPRSAWYVLPLFLFFWGLNALIAMNLLHSITNISMNSSQISKSDSYCHFLPKSKTKWFFLTCMVLRDAGFQGIMGGASGYMVHVLHKHHQQILHLQNSKFLYTTPPEIKAAQSVLLLMLCFLLLYWIDCLLSVFISSSLGNQSTVINAREFLTVGYAVLSPFVLIHREGRLGHGMWGSPNTLGPLHTTRPLLDNPADPLDDVPFDFAPPPPYPPQPLPPPPNSSSPVTSPSPAPLLPSSPISPHVH
ncbi:vomeronasal type-1 receptor 4-like [Erethizon dorsatum]